jgi:hypothetical protein
MEYTQAANVLGRRLDAGGDEDAAPAAIALAMQGWRDLANDDPIWDLVGLVLLSLRTSLYPDVHVTVEADKARSGQQTRTAVAGLLHRLAEHHQRLTAGTRPLADRLQHDAVAQQLRQIAATLV